MMNQCDVEATGMFMTTYCFKHHDLPDVVDLPILSVSLHPFVAFGRCIWTMLLFGVIVDIRIWDKRCFKTMLLFVFLLTSESGTHVLSRHANVAFWCFFLDFRI